jgi:hypothetical protein
MTVSNIGFTFTVNDISLKLTPNRISPSNEFDYFGSLLSTERIAGETNTGYKSRLLDVFVHKGSSAYTGYTYAITRELGLELSSPIKLTSNPSLEYPAIFFSQNFVYIYSDFFNDVLEMKINRSDIFSSNYFLGGLVNTINTSTSFTAVLLDADHEYSRSDFVLDSTNVKNVNRQGLNSSNLNFLGNGKILKGSVILSDTTAFKKEVTTLTSPGDFNINYSTGVIRSQSTPISSSEIRYSFIENEFIPEISPIIVRSISHSDFQPTLFHQIEQTDGTFASGKVTVKGAQIINELLSVKNTTFGP